MYTSYQYTKNIGSLFQNTISQISTFYCREDFNLAIKEYKKADAASIQFVLPKLEKMCEAKGVELSQLLHNPSVLQSIPSRVELQEELLSIFYNLCRSAPSAEAYMERIVRTLVPEYQNDTVRVAILKKFIIGLGFHCKTHNISAIVDWALERMSITEREQYAKFSKQEQLSKVIDSLNDTIFCPEHLVMDLTPLEILMLMQKQLSKNSKISFVDKSGAKASFSDFFADNRTLSPNTMEAYRELCDILKMPNQLNAEAAIFISTVVDTVASRELSTTETECLIRFVSHLESDFSNCLKHNYYTSKTGKIMPVSEMFDQSKKDARKKKKGNTWKLIILCNDLASGNFKTNNGQTRVNLYHFAILMGMSLPLGLASIDPSHDMRKHLFEDYYCDNLTRFLSDESQDSRTASSWEKEPSGDGINFKNFSEAIYIYYLCKNDLGLTPGQKIDHAENAIQECLNGAYSEQRHHIAQSAHTEIYRNTFLDVILEAEEDRLVSLILSYYPIVGTGNTKTQYSSEMNTAYDVAVETMEEIENGTEFKSSALMETDRVEIADKYIEDIGFSASVAFEWKLAPFLKKKYASDEAFVRLVDNINRRLSVEFDWISIKKKNILAYMLQALYLHSSLGQPISMKKLKPLLQEVDVTISDGIIEQSIDILKSVGFDVSQYSGLEESIVSWDVVQFKEETKKLCGTSNSKTDNHNTTLARSILDILYSHSESHSVVNLREIALTLSIDMSVALEEAKRMQDYGSPINIDISYDALLSWKKDLSDTFLSDSSIEKYIESLPKCRQEQAKHFLETIKSFADQSCMLRLKSLRSLLSKKRISVTLKELSDIVSEVVKNSACIERTGVNASLFSLGYREYDSKELNEVISRIKNRYYINENLVNTLLTEILNNNPYYEKRITRTTLLALYTNYYVSNLLPYTSSISSFYDLYEDFTSTINPVLEECRFQNLHEKNVLDMYIILSLYFYVVENGIEIEEG